MPSPFAYVPRLLYRNVAITVVGQIDTAGVLTDDTVSMSLVGRAGRVVQTRRWITEDISSDDALVTHHEQIKLDWRLTLEAVKIISGPDLEDMTENYAKLKVIISSRRTTSTIHRRTYWGAVEGDDWNIVSGGNRDSLSLLPLDLGTNPNPFLETVSG